MKKKKVKKTKEEGLFVSLDKEAVETAVIEASKESLNFLHYFEGIKKIREKKMAVLSSLQKNIGETRVLINKLRKLMPRQRLAGAGLPLKEKGLPTKETGSKDAELEALEKELAEIEKGLSTK